MGGYFGCVKPVADFNTDPPISTLRITAAQPLMTRISVGLSWMATQVNGTSFLDPGATVRVTMTTALVGRCRHRYQARDCRQTGTGDTAVLGRRGQPPSGESATIDEFKVVSVMSGSQRMAVRHPAVISDCTRGELIKPTIKSGGLVFSVVNTLNDKTPQILMRIEISCGTRVVIWHVGKLSQPLSQ